MKSNIIRIFALICVILLSLTGCDNTQNNNDNEPSGSDNETDLPACELNHDYTILKYDTKSHWYECVCGDKKDVVAHDYNIAGEVTREPTEEATGTQIYSCVCGKTTEKEIPVKEHTHNYATTLSSDETNHWYECACGDKKDLVAHDYNIAGEVTKESTCENAGTQIYSCECGETKELEVPAKGHKYDNLETNWNEYVTDVISDSPTRYQVLAHAADEGLYLKIEQYVNNVVIKDDPSDWNSTHVEMKLFNHCIGYGWDGTYLAFFANGVYYINNNWNCSGVYNCAEVIENPADSKYKYTVSYNIFIAFPNNLENPQDGPYAYVDIMYHTPNEDEIGFEYSTIIIQDGNRNLWKDSCDSYEVRKNGIIQKMGKYHDYTIAGEVTKEPTCTETGLQIYSCECGESKELEVPAKGHNPSTVLTSGETTHWYTCSNCNDKINEVSHNYVIAGEITKEPSCEGKGSQTYSCVCGATTENDIQETGHNHSLELTSGETTHWYACSKCDDRKDEVSHDYTIAGEITKEPTYEEAGSQTYSCVCGATTEKEVPALKHIYSTKLTSGETTHWYACSECDDRKDEEPHKYTIAGEVTKEPTCKDKGAQIFSCVCGVKIEKEIDEKAHEYKTLKHDTEYHWLECICGEKSNIEVHSGGEATFTELAVCTTCNTSYGKLKAHDYENLVFDGDLTNFSSQFLIQEVDNGVSKATAIYTAEYTLDGIIIYFQVVDNDIYSSNNLGMSDNVEIQVLAHDTSYLSQRHTFNIICGADGQYLLRKWDKGFLECMLNNADFNYTFRKITNGYEGSVFFSYNVLETNEIDANGNIRVQFNMRNTATSGETVFEEYDYLGSTYELPYTWFVLNENDFWVRKDFEKFSFGSEYDYIFDNLAQISSIDGEHKNVKNGSPMFKNSNVCLNEYGLPTELLENGSYIRGDKNGYTTTVETSGYVVVAVNDLAGDLNQYFINQGYTQIKKYGRTIATYLGTNSIDFIQLVNYYVKWLPAGSTITTNVQWCVVFGARDNSLPEETWFVEPGYITTDMDNPMYAENDQIFTAAPSMIATQNNRIFSQWHTGGAYEPVEENCTKFKYSDDLGKTWKDAFVLDSWINQQIGGDKNNVGCDYTLGINDKNELFIYYVFRENTTGNQTCNSSTWVMKLINPDADPSEWEFTESKLVFPNVLLKNAFRKLSDGTYILAGQYCPDERYINVYKSYDQCDTWELIGRVYSPQCNSYDEPIIMERSDGSLWMTMRTRKGVMYQSVSLDGGQTWSISEKYTMPNANTRFYIGKMSNGYWYMIYNNSSTSRTKMTIAVSKDEGQTWENKLCVYSSYCSYPDSVIIDGKIHLVFDDGRYKQYQWRTEEDGKVKTWGYIYHYSISETELLNMSYRILDVEELDVVARCAEYTFDYIEGSGTEDDPYLIKDRYSWNVISSLNETEGMSFEGVYFKLTDDITIYGNKKIGIQKTPFAGIFDGNGHTITYNMSFGVGEANQGLFGTISNTAIIRNLKVDGTLNTLNTGNANIGSIVGINRGGLVENCESSVVITAKGDRIGGLVAICDGGKIINSIFKGSITTTSTTSGNGVRGVGGIVALLSSAGVAEVSNCTNEGTINATCRQVGGIVGYSNGTSTIRHTISNCVNNGNITSTSTGNDTANEGVAGIVAVSFYTNITICENNGVITAKTSAQVGGVVGKCCDGSSVKNCVNNSTVIAIQYVGGIAGRHVGGGTTMDSCTNNGNVYCTSTATTYGQIYGQNGATVTNCTENGTAEKQS